MYLYNYSCDAEAIYVIDEIVTKPEIPLKTTRFATKICYNYHK